MPLDLNECDGHPIQGVCMHSKQYSWDRIWIHKALIELVSRENQILIKWNYNFILKCSSGPLEDLWCYTCYGVKTILILITFPAVRFEGNRKVPYHYYEVGSRDECAEYILHESAPYGGHRFITEKTVFSKWAKKKSIKFFHPEWQLSWPAQDDSFFQALKTDWS